FGLHDDLKAAGVLLRLELAVNRLGEAPLGADRVHEARREAAATENVVHDLDSVVIGVRARHPGVAEDDIRLGELFVDLDDRRGPGGGRGSGGFGAGLFLPGLEGARELAGDLFFRDIADDGDDRAFGPDIVVVIVDKRRPVDALDRFRGALDLPAVRALRVERLHELDFRDVAGLLL